MSTARLRNLSLLAASFGYFLIRGRARKLPAHPSKILVFQGARMGDMVCTTHVFRAIKQKYPDVKLYVIGDKINKIVLEGNKDVDEYITYEKKFLQSLRELRKEKIDVAFLTGPGPEALALVYLAGIRSIMAPILTGDIYSPLRTRSYAFLAWLTFQQPHHLDRYAPAEYIRRLEPLGIHTTDTAKHLFYSNQAMEMVTDFFSRNGMTPGRDFIVGIAPSSGLPIKNWAPEKFAKLIDWLVAEKNAKVLLIGSGRDKAEVDAVIPHIRPETKYTNAYGVFSIDELKALTSKLSLFVSGDTGPLYIAEAFKIPSVDILGPVDENMQPLHDPIHKVVMVERAKPELTMFNARVYDQAEALRQMDDITVQMVEDKVNELLSELSIGKVLQ